MLGLKKYSWDEVSNIIFLINPEFKNIIDEISPSANYPVYIGAYPYGALILDKGIFQVINDEQELVPLTHASINNKIKEDLSYTGTIPMGMIIKNSIETFFILENRTIPSSFYRGGDMISLWSVLEGEESYQAGPLWSVSSGARTICMLPKITDKSCNEALKHKYNLKQNIPRSLNDHWSMFERIANHKQFSQPWNCEILYFSKKWFQHRDDKKWSRFYQFILDKAWKDSTFKRNQFIFDFAFSLTQKNKNLKPNPYLADTFKHLIGMGTGGVPGLTPAIDNVAGPIEGLQKTYIQDYGLKKYLPVIMHLYHFDLKELRPIYYSLEMPTTIVFSPRSSQASSKMVDMRELRDILKAFYSETLKGHLMIEKTPLFRLAQNVRYNFYHRDHDQYDEISISADIIKHDSNFKQILCKSKHLNFPEFSPFFNGCISVTADNNV